MVISLRLRATQEMKNYTGRGKGCTIGETRMKGSIGAPTRTSRTNDNNVGDRER
jgi:hypothetical protein